MRSTINLNELTLATIGDWPAMAKLLTCALLVIMIVAVGYGFDIKQQLQVLQQAKEKTAQLEQSLQAKQNLRSNIAAYQQQSIIMSRELGRLLQHLPTRSEVPGILEDISKAAANNGLKFKLFKPEPEKQTDFFTELPINILVVGNYHQLARFISQISTLNHTITLHDFKMTPSLQNTNKDNLTLGPERLTGKLILDIRAKTYQVKFRPKSNLTAPPKHNTLKKIQYTASDLRSPFQPDRENKNLGVAPSHLQRKKTPLEKFPMNTLKMVGTMSQDKTIWALIKTPDDHVYRISVGDYIGEHSSKVIAIAPDKVQVRQRLQIADVWENQQITLSLKARRMDTAARGKKVEKLNDR